MYARENWLELGEMLMPLVIFFWKVLLRQIAYASLSKWEQL